MITFQRNVGVLLVLGWLACAGCWESQDSVPRGLVCEQLDVEGGAAEVQIAVGCWDYDPPAVEGALVIVKDCSFYYHGSALVYTTEAALKDLADWCADEGLYLRVIDCEPEHWQYQGSPPAQMPDKLVACGP